MRMSAASEGRRSRAWYAGEDRNAFIHRAWMRRGLPDDAFDGRPHIAICSTWSDLSPCDRHLEEVSEHVARGVWQAGGIPLQIPVPSLVVAGGPMLTGTWRGAALGCGTDVWRLSEEVRAGTLARDEFLGAESAMIRSRGHCNTMGTASTMACLAEALGTTLPGNAGIPAPDSRLLGLGHRAGRRIVEMVDER